MKCEDVIKQLQAMLPKVTDLFTDEVAISSLTYSAGVVTAITAAAHGYTTNDYTNIIGSENPVGIVSISRVGTIATVVTDADHDLTLGTADIKSGGKSVIQSGATEAEFNGTFELLGVSNRRTYTIEVADSGPVSVTGSPIAENASVAPGFNVRSAVTVIDPTTFTYPVSQVLFATAHGTPIARTEARVTGSVTIERALDGYSAQSNDDLWAFVVLGDVIASKNQDVKSDLTDTMTKTGGWKQRVSQPFTVYAISPSVDENFGRQSRDLMEDVMVAFFKSLLGVQFNTGLFSSEQFVCTFLNHGFSSYNNATYVHEFNFEMAADITFDDTVGYDFDVAFRDINVSIVSNIDTQVEEATAEIDLDEEPLP